MRRIITFIAACCISFALSAQEVLLPLSRPSNPPTKSTQALTLPFFDDFSDTTITIRQWELGGTFVNQGYAPLPPTIGMATLDAYDVHGELYPTATGQLFFGDTLLSMPLRLDSMFSPSKREITLADSLYLTFFFTPGGGHGNRWEGIGDRPEEQDSLKLEFFDADSNVWNTMWNISGISADSLFVHTGNYWQFVEIPITDARYLRPGFRFRFRNLCSLDNDSKRGLLGNADHWNIDYVYLNTARRHGDSTLRDIAFVNPAPSLLRRYQAMPAKQYTTIEMTDSLALTITNRFSQELATNFGYVVCDQSGNSVYNYDGGFENAPVYWAAHEYQTSQAHANPNLAYSFPCPMAEHSEYDIMFGIREGVSGDNYPQNDTIRYRQIFDNYFAYDDGIAENGYGLSATSGAHPKIACRFEMNVEDTLTAVYIYFNHTLNNDNAGIRFQLTVWDDNNGKPGNIIYQDAQRRYPEFKGFNQYVRYILDSPVICNGTIYVGLSQATSDYLNIGFDRNNDASQYIMYQTSQGWQTTILRGALMLRPYFGVQATLCINDSPEMARGKVTVCGKRITITTQENQPITIFDAMGRLILSTRCQGEYTSHILPKGIYLVKIGSSNPVKAIIL